MSLYYKSLDSQLRAYRKQLKQEEFNIQYQKAQKENPYPWGIRMPNSESNKGEFISR